MSAYSNESDFGGTNSRSSLDSSSSFASSSESSSRASHSTRYSKKSDDRKRRGAARTHSPSIPGSAQASESQPASNSFVSMMQSYNPQNPLDMNPYHSMNMSSASYTNMSHQQSINYDLGHFGEFGANRSSSSSSFSSSYGNGNGKSGTNIKQKSGGILKSIKNFGMTKTTIVVVLALMCLIGLAAGHAYSSHLRNVTENERKSHLIEIRRKRKHLQSHFQNSNNGENNTHKEESPHYTPPSSSSSAIVSPTMYDSGYHHHHNITVLMAGTKRQLAVQCFELLERASNFESITIVAVTLGSKLQLASEYFSYNAANHYGFSLKTGYGDNPSTRPSQRLIFDRTDLLNAARYESNRMLDLYRTLCSQNGTISYASRIRSVHIQQILIDLEKQHLLNANLGINAVISDQKGSNTDDILEDSPHCFNKSFAYFTILKDYTDFVASNDLSNPYVCIIDPSSLTIVEQWDALLVQHWHDTRDPMAIISCTPSSPYYHMLLKIYEARKIEKVFQEERQTQIDLSGHTESTAKNFYLPHHHSTRTTADETFKLEHFVEEDEYFERRMWSAENEYRPSMETVNWTLNQLSPSLIQILCDVDAKKIASQFANPHEDVITSSLPTEQQRYHPNYQHFNTTACHIGLSSVFHSNLISRPADLPGTWLHFDVTKSKNAANSLFIGPRMDAPLHFSRSSLHGTQKTNSTPFLDDRFYFGKLEAFLDTPEDFRLFTSKDGLPSFSATSSSSSSSAMQEITNRTANLDYRSSCCLAQSLRFWTRGYNIYNPVHTMSYDRVGMNRVHMALSKWIEKNGSITTDVGRVLYYYSGHSSGKNHAVESSPNDSIDDKDNNSKKIDTSMAIIYGETVQQKNDNIMNNTRAASASATTREVNNTNQSNSTSSILITGEEKVDFLLRKIPVSSGHIFNMWYYMSSSLSPEEESSFFDLQNDARLILMKRNAPFQLATESTPSLRMILLAAYLCGDEWIATPEQDSLAQFGLSCVLTHRNKALQDTRRSNPQNIPAAFQLSFLYIVNTSGTTTTTTTTANHPKRNSSNLNLLNDSLHRTIRSVYDYQKWVGVFWKSLSLQPSSFPPQIDRGPTTAVISAPEQLKLSISREGLAGIYSFHATSGEQKMKAVENKNDQHSRKMREIMLKYDGSQHRVEMIISKWIEYLKS